MLSFQHLSRVLQLAACVGMASACSQIDTSELFPEPDPTTAYEVQPLHMRRLLARQYRNSVAQLLGNEAAAFADPPHDAAINGYRAIASSQLTLTADMVQRYEASARAIASNAMANNTRLNQLLDCNPTTEPADTCYQQFIRNFGLRAWRRPLNDDEVASYLNVGRMGSEEYGDFYAGLELLISAMLQSPNFLYQIELGKPANDNPRELSNYELASRMAFFLSDAPPDDALLDAAGRGELDDATRVQQQARRLLSSQAAVEANQAFFEEFLELEGLEQLSKDPNLFPGYNSALARSMKEETLRLVDDVLWQRNASFRELFTADYTFVDAQLAAHYGVEAPPEGQWQRTQLPEEQQRLGILSHASILATQAHPTSTSATYRGRFIMERFLCTSMPPPPDDVATQLPPSSTAPTLRERLQVHLTEPSCRACHEMSDNLGLVFENYDAVGRYRSHENGAELDLSGELSELGAFVGVRELAPRLRDSDDVMHCVVRQLYRHASGRVENKEEWPLLDSLKEQFADSDYNFQELLVALVASDGFRRFRWDEENTP